MASRVTSGKIPEIEGAPAKLEESKRVLEQRGEEAKKNQEEIKAIRGEHERLNEHPALGLADFCESCAWAGKTTCGERAQYMMDKYNMGKVAGRLSAMEVETCKKSA